MLNRITVYMARMGLITNKITSRTIGIDEPLPKNCYFTEHEALEAYKLQQQKSANDYARHLPAANEKLNKLEHDIKRLLKNVDGELLFTYDGDSHGIYNESLELSVTINNRAYTKKIDL